MKIQTIKLFIFAIFSQLVLVGCNHTVGGQSATDSIAMAKTDSVVKSAKIFMRKKETPKSAEGAGATMEMGDVLAKTDRSVADFATLPHQWQDLAGLKVNVHVDSKPLDKLIEDAVAELEPYAGPWEVKWKLKKNNKDVLKEEFSLDAETTFDEFASYISDFMVNHRGFKLKFVMFEQERILVVSD